MSTSYTLALRISIFLLGFFILFYLAYHIGKKPYSQEIRIIGAIKRALQEPDKVDAIVLGSSHAGAIRPEFLGYQHPVNLQYGGADLLECSYLGNSLIPYLPNLKTIFVTISYFSFSYDNAAFIDHNGNKSRSETRRNIYKATPSLKFIHNDFQNYIFGKFYPIFTEDHWEKLVQYIIFKANGKKKTENRKRGKKRRKKFKLAIKYKDKKALLNNHGEQKPKRIIKIVSSMKRNNPGIESDSLKALCNLIEYAKNNNIDIVFVTTPFWSTYTAYFDSYYRELVKKNMGKIVKKYGVEYYDLSSAPLFMNNPEYFSNADHIHRNAYPVFNELLRKTRYSELSKRKITLLNSS